MADPKDNVGPQNLVKNADPQKANMIAMAFGGQDKSKDQSGAIQRRMNQQASGQ